MELNVQTEANALKMQMDSGISLNMQIPSPISMKVTGVVYGGGGGADIEAIEELIDESTTTINAHTSSEREKIMGGKMVTYEEDYLPAAQCGTDNSDFRPVVIGDADYTLNDEYAFAIANGLSVGDVIRVLADNSGDGHEPMAVPKTINEAALAIVAYGSEPTIDGVTEWLNFEKDKCYIVTGVYEVADGEGDTWLVYTFEEYEPGRSGKEIYDKVDEVKEAVENINVESADLVAAFFNITEATVYTALTPAEAIAIARDCQYNVMGTDWPIPTWLPTGVTEAQVESAAEGLGIPYHEPTQTA